MLSIFQSYSVKAAPYSPQALLSRGWRASAQLFYGIIYKDLSQGHGRSPQLWKVQFSPFSSLANCCGVRPINFAKRYRETPCSIRATRTTSPKGHGVLSVFSLNRHHRLLLDTHGFCRLIHQSSRLHAQRMGEQISVESLGSLSPRSIWLIC